MRAKHTSRPQVHPNPNFFAKFRENILQISFFLIIFAAVNTIHLFINSAMINPQLFRRWWSIGPLLITGCFAIPFTSCSDGAEVAPTVPATSVLALESRSSGISSVIDAATAELVAAKYWDDNGISNVEIKKSEDNLYFNPPINNDSEIYSKSPQFVGSMHAGYPTKPN